MKTSKVAIISFFFFCPIFAYSDLIQVGCAVKTYNCIPLPDGTTKCNWSYDLGGVQDISLSRTGTSPSYEIWEGSVSRKIRGIYPYVLSIYQRREGKNKINFLSLKLTVDDIETSGTSQNILDLGHLAKANGTGIGLRCTTDLVPGSQK